MGIVLRRFEYQDVEELTRLGVINHLESRFKDIVPVSEVSIQKLIFNVLNDQDSYVGIVALDDTKIVGYMIGFITSYAFNEDTYYAGDEMVYVIPEYRGRLVGKRILKEFTNWAISKGCVEAVIGTISEIATERTKKLYSKLGFTEVGSLFRMRI
jgi:GNAT superfamily N-acetyltransferase